MDQANLISKLNRALPPASRAALAALVVAAERRALSLYLVGGALRDLLLDRPTLDLDLTVEGDAPTLTREASAALPHATCVVHAAFGTATLKGPDFHLDVATARAETYERPGALPTVRAGDLRDDLLRRDFTVNAIALALTGPRRGEIIDPFAGQNDLDAGLIRALHDESFRDDATRILRAARYESRLGLRPERKTLRLLRRDVRYLDTISGARVREELSRTLREPEPERVLRRLHELGALAAVHPTLSFGRARALAFARLRKVRDEPSANAYLALLAWGVTLRRADSLAARLALDSRARDAVRGAAELSALEPKLSPGVRPSRVVELLSAFPSPAVWALAAAGATPARDLALRYLHRWRHVKPSLDGHDLLALSAPPGPEVGRLLHRLRAAKLDGEVRSRRQEEALALALIGEGEEASR